MTSELTKGSRVAAAALDQALGRLREHFGDRLSTLGGVRQEHGRGYAHYAAVPPDAVVFAHSTDDVQRVVAMCAEFGVPIVPYGAGTSAHGQLSAISGGISLDLAGLDNVIAVHPENFDVVVQPGVLRKSLGKYLSDTGLFFPIDPGADASLGGMASTRASGTSAVRYGTMKDNVLALQVVMPDGSVVRTGSRAKKSSMGYDLTRLFVGAEGTLGVITELTLRLYPVTEAVSAAICSFATLEGAIATAINTIQLGIPVARMELMDEWAVRASNRHSKLDLKEAPTLFFEFHGTTMEVEEQARTVGDAAAGNGGEGFSWARLREDRERLWQARHESTFATSTYWPGRRSFPTDACVPLPALSENILAARADIDASFLQGKILGHVGDGNFHASYAVRSDSEEDIVEAERLFDRVVKRALESGGTASGEHGVGVSMLRYMDAENGGSLAVMRAIKSVLDPQGIMNPGKLIPKH